MDWFHELVLTLSKGERFSTETSTKFEVTMEEIRRRTSVRTKVLRCKLLKSAAIRTWKSNSSLTDSQILFL